MIANFQTLKVAERYRDALVSMGYVSTNIMSYRGGYRVFTTGIRMWSH